MKTSYQSGQRRNLRRKGKKDFDVKKEAKVSVIDKEDGDLTDKAVVEGLDTSKIGEQK